MACCNEVRRISAYHDGELGPTEAQELAGHILQCPSCRQELDRLRALSQWLSAAPAADIPAGAMDRLRHCFRPGRDRIVLRTMKALTAAAAVVLLVCSALLWRGGQPGAGPVDMSAEWERAAVMPASAEPMPAGAAVTAGTEADMDLRLARSILGPFFSKGGNGYE